MRLRVLLAALLIAATSAFLGAPPASAYCAYNTCSQIKHKENDSSYFTIRCIHVGNWSETFRLYGGQQSACGRYWDYVWVLPTTELWCRELGVDEPYTRYWTAGGHPWNHWQSLNCKVVFP